MSQPEVLTSTTPTRILHGDKGPTAIAADSTGQSVQVSLLQSGDDWRSAVIRKPWEDRVGASDNIDVLFQSPTWFEHIAASEPDKRLAMAVARSSSDDIVGLAPLVRGRFPLRYEVRGRCLWNSSIGSVFIFGGESLLPPRTEYYDALFALVEDAFAEESCVCFFSLLKDSFCWRYLQESALVRDRFLMYMPGGVRPYHAIGLPATFEEYLKKFNHKKRYNLQRQLKLLEKATGPLSLQKVQTREQATRFYDLATRIARQSWQYAAMGTALDVSYEEMLDLAERDLLRSYLLMAGDRACAYVVGYQFRDVYYYAQVGYDQAFASSSPGTGLLYLLIKDLIENTSVRRLSFDYGDAGYKREFGNVHGQDATVLLLRKTLANRLRRQLHGAFGSMVKRLKTWFVRRPN